MKANMDIEFDMGIGHLTATQYRDIAVIFKGSLNRTGTITFNDVEAGDVISIDGICSGTAKLDMDVNTRPSTPRNYTEGDFFDELDIL
jgi:hypothetical protein